MLNICAGLAIFFHFYAFIVESIMFMKPKNYLTFGARNEEQAKAMKVLAFNQGFYNLFLAIIMGIGLALFQEIKTVEIGAGFLMSSAFCMAGAGAVLFLSKPSAWYISIAQSLPPAIILYTINN